jgi:hypothetical protein
MFNNMCGVQLDGWNRNNMIQSVMRLVNMLPETQLRASEVEAQLNCIGPNACDDGNYYKYVYGSLLPANQPDLFRPDALVSNPDHKPADKKYFVRNLKHEVHKLVEKVGVNPQLAALERDSVPTPRDPNAPRVVATIPAEGSKTRRVWDISERCYAQHPHYDKALRALVAAACESEGINSSTMSVQFGKWKHSKTVS